MGNDNSVDFKDYHTQAELKGFLDRVDKTNMENKKYLEKLDTAMKEVNTDEKLVQFASAYYEAECACNLPQYVFWLSESKRNACHEAKMKMFSQGMLFANSVIHYNKLANVSEQLSSQIQYLNRVTKTNLKYTK